MNMNKQRTVRLLALSFLLLISVSLFGAGNPQLVLLLTVLGFLGFAGVHRIILNQIGMGILYFFTAGLCLIGTIVDLVNYQSMAFGFNRVVATEIHAMIAGNK